MSDETALLAAIWEHPHEDTPRLMYADWLQENGQPDRAEFIRIQCEIARLGEDDGRRDDLRKREVRIWKKCGRGWKEGLPPNVRCNRFERGFPTNRNVGIPARRFLKFRASDLASVPLWDYYLENAGPVWNQLLASPNLAHLRCFTTSLSGCGPEAVRALVNCPYTRNLVALSLSSWEIGAEGLNVLSTATELPSLRELDLSHNKLGNEVRIRTAHSPLFAHLRSLRLGGNEIGGEGFMTVVGAFGIRQVETLELAHSPFGDHGISRLGRWAGLSSVRTLVLYRAELSDLAATELADCPALARLKELYLGWNRIGPTGALALASSPHLTALSTLYLNDNPLCVSGRAVAALRARFGEAVHF